MLINGVELEDIDMLDVEVVEKYELLLEGLKSHKDYKGLKSSQVVRAQCKEVFNFFNVMFGEGTDKKVFGERVNIGICIDALAELVNELGSRLNESEKAFNKYCPNRSQKVQ